ncbi:MAG: hypothetical protein JNK37_06705 [Verrucomicrobiales bacterium]|nr:hypothetical protein [Verrucomicrobiales bacterium]
MGKSSVSGVSKSNAQANLRRFSEKETALAPVTTALCAAPRFHSKKAGKIDPQEQFLPKNGKIFKYSGLLNYQFLLEFPESG